MPECNLRFLQKLFDRLDHRVFIFEFQARAAEQNVKPELLVVSVVRMAAHGREFNAVVISRKLVFLAAHLEVEFVIGRLRGCDYFAVKRVRHREFVGVSGIKAGWINKEVTSVGFWICRGYIYGFRIATKPSYYKFIC